MNNVKELVNFDLEMLREYKIAVSAGLLYVVKLSVKVESIRMIEEYIALINIPTELSPIADYFE